MNTEIGRSVYSVKSSYFILRSEVLDGYCAIFLTPTGMLDIHKPATGVRMGDAYPQGLRFQMAKEEKGLKIADIIPNALGYFMVSARMKALLEQHAGVEIEFLRFTLLNHRGRVAGEDCYIANVIGVQDWVDAEKSDGTRKASNPNRFLFLRRLVLDNDKLDPEIRLFRTVTVPRLPIVRQDFKELLEREGMTGPTFYPVGAEVAFTP
ncbi:hypothetical protein OV208_20140 [Corallococcus sp. bb12-1]|uniref:imm11 family protein n=1 Tax=Corallococcus sp. bb12-1 TaxID=2996784 RepID=UPI0022715447|nr:DUF1629 domain-containing protein [Corallococcus sp. bb12-1]MCY1043640.1 hypothetical protein [Corallococcus sp. bb12-1]